jgi:uncharacterized protein
VRIIRFSDLAVSPWVNGKGETRQVSACVDPARHPDFLWRISMATVGAHAPFSRLKGIDRTISVLKGEGLDLTVDGERHRLTREAPPFRFDGGSETSGGSIAGETLDLNVMSRRGFHEHHVRKVLITDTASIVAGHEHTFLIFAGPAKLQIGAETFTMDTCDSLCEISAGSRVDVHVAAPDYAFEIVTRSAEPVMRTG